ncbi:hypothetical protein ANN_22735 [Periplaneta americana]|uniref:Uncharacterized protein n=1 Tax=Periplaneta americana TaxID=6978 RepID=A0ABQ8SJA6_PERAM|nr:hypothetical protein ANN_22735 [Periplaneta americana]
MAGLCEGGNEPPGFLKAILTASGFERVSDRVRGRRNVGRCGVADVRGTSACREGKGRRTAARGKGGRKAGGSSLCEVKGETKPPEQNRPGRSSENRSL